MTKKGLAQVWGGYRDVLKPQWWYDWSPVPDDPTKVPMLRSGLPNVSLPVDYSDYVLVFNEPNVHEPNGCWVPDYMEGIARYAVLAHVYPQAQFIVGSVSAWSYSWLVRFHKMAIRCKLRLPLGYAIHGYAGDYGTLATMFGWWQKAHDQIKAITPGLEFWITETGDMKGRPTVLKAIWAKALALDADRAGFYTDRQPDAPWAISKGVEMINDSGLTPIGEAFVELDGGRDDNVV